MTKAIILAAGQGTRMKSELPKVAHKILEKSLIDYVIESGLEAGVDEIAVIVGHKKEMVKENIHHQVTYYEQNQQLGTGHAVLMAKAFIQPEDEIVILFGDVPLITGETLQALLASHRAHQRGVTLLSTHVQNPTGYGRIIRDQNGQFQLSVEHKDATDEQKRVTEINSGMYVFNGEALLKGLAELKNDNKQGEYYLPDTIFTIQQMGLPTESYITNDHEEILGINDRLQLAEAAEIMQRRINRKHMVNGVTFIDPKQAYISKEALIGQDTIIYPNTFIKGASQIGNNCIVGPMAVIESSTIGDGTEINQSTVLKSTIGSDTHVGPFAYVRPNSVIGNHIKIGDFVEVKNAVIGDGTKISHLTYVGDAEVGRNVNFGCGSVIVNYDGVNKFKTIVEDNAFIGCNTNLISPVRVHANAYTAAGSTITNDVPEDALAIGRAKQINIENWVTKKRPKRNK